MKVNTIEWAKCPKCDTLINGYEFYPVSALFNHHNYYERSECPKCKAELFVNARVEIKFDAVVDDPMEKAAKG